MMSDTLSLLEITESNNSFKKENESISLENALNKISNEDYKGGLQILQLLILSNPNNSTIHQHIGECQLQLRMIHEAEQSFLLSNTPKSWFSLFEIYLKQEKFQNAFKALKRSQSIEALMELIKIRDDPSSPLYIFRDNIDLGMIKCLLGTRYLLGEDGLMVNENLALQLYKESVSLDYSSGFTGLAYMYEQGLGGLEKNIQKAIAYYKEGAERGCVRAMSNLGNCYLQGEGVPVNEEEAVKWLSKASKEGDSDSLTLLGMYYANKQEKKSTVNITDSPTKPLPTHSPELYRSSITLKKDNSILSDGFKSISRKSPHRTGSSPTNSYSDNFESFDNSIHLESPELVKRALERRSLHESVFSESDMDQRGSIDLRSLRLMEKESSPLKSRYEVDESNRNYDDVVVAIPEDKVLTKEVITSVVKVDMLKNENFENLQINLKSNSFSASKVKKSKVSNRIGNSVLALSIITNSIIFFTNLLGQIFSICGVIASVLLYILYMKDYRFLYCMGTVVLSFFIHLLSFFCSIIALIILRTKRMRWISFINVGISFGSVLSSFSFALGLAIIFTILHLNNIINLTKWS